MSHDFDSGEFIEFGLELDMSTLKLIDHGPTVFATFDYDDDVVHVPNKGNKIVGWPRTYTVTFLLAEIDNGGFPNFVQQIFERLKDKAAQAIGLQSAA